MKSWDTSELHSFLEFTQDDDLCSVAPRRAHWAQARGIAGPPLDGPLSRRGTAVDSHDPGVGELRDSVCEEPKTPRARRTVALDALTVKILKEHRKSQLEQRLAAGAAYRDNDLVFCETDGSPIHPQVASDRFDRIVERSGLPRISMKGLRHTHATLALKAGVRVKVVSERLGHTSTSFTMDTYAHVLPGMQEDAAEMVAGLVAGSGVERGSKSGRPYRPEAEE